MFLAINVASLFELDDVAEHSAGNADSQHRQLANGFVLDAAGNVDDHAGMELNLVIVEDHRPAAGDDVIELVRAGVIVELGVVDFHVMHLSRGFVLLFHEAADVAAGLPPGLDFSRIAAEIFGSDGGHGSLREEEWQNDGWQNNKKAWE